MKKTGKQLLRKALDKEDEYEMPRNEAIKEHKRLVKILRSGNSKLQKEEALKQEKELKKIIKGE